MAESFGETDRRLKVKAMNDDRITKVHKNAQHMPERMKARIEICVVNHGLCCLQTGTIIIKSATVSVCLLSQRQ
jgi:hypothetical protein